MIIIKWHKDETEEEPLYELYAYTENDYKIQIGILGWVGFKNSWMLSYQIPRIQNRCIKYENYTIDEVNDVLFRAILDIQSDLAKINNICINYCNAISDYVIDYITGVEQDED